MISFFEERMQVAESYGIDRGDIILDPGIGFGKSME
jgi:dihydropteroate synthase